jgi:hypothetical protein
MKTAFINPITDTAWNDFISRMDQATIFHHPAWLSILHRHYNFKVFAVCTLNEDSTIRSGIPFCEVKDLRGKTRWISLPFSDHCTPLFENETDLQELLHFIILHQGSDKNNSVEIRSDVSCVTNRFLKDSYSVLHVKNLSNNIDDVFVSLKKTQVQQPILKGVRDGLTSCVANDKHAVQEFYKLHLMTRKRLGVPVQPRKFFDKLHEHIISQNLGYIVLVNKNHQCISAGIFSGYANTLTYKYGASDDTMLHWRPNNLMVWTAMQEAVRRGFRKFDFGKTDCENEGLRKFKSGWGAQEQSLYFSYYPEVPQHSLLSTIKNKIVIPVIQHSPLFVCRWTGELFYKYFA